LSTILHGCLPDTEYIQVTSRSGLDYAVWITTPPGYAESTDTVPLIYVLDGNWTVGFTAPLIVTQKDPFLSIAPYIQITVGYAGQEASDWSQLRNRDLVPPGEPIGDDVVAALESALEAGTMSQTDVDAYIAQISDCNADAFLDFLVQELHPLLQSRLRVSAYGHGLFGYSYGGLFALYAWLRGGTPFATVGAGTPGVSSAEVELWGDVPVYRGLARNVLRALEELRAEGRADVVSTSMLDETHVTGVQASFLSYLKQCHVR
jgi:predicted alpha/beta superfamily hydrolase